MACIFIYLKIHTVQMACKQLDLVRYKIRKLSM
jgi:hypothetical protein